MWVDGVIVTGPREVDRRQLEIRPPERDDVVVQVLACGLCTWEQRVYRGLKPTYPFWGGHEVCGIVEHIARGASPDVKLGDMVSVALLDRCGTCRWCRTGLDNHCSYVYPRPCDDLPMGPRGLSSQLVVRPNKLIPLDRSLSPRHGALLEPIACTLRAVHRSGVRAGGSAVVVGTGTLGVLHVRALKAMGVEVIACEPDAIEESDALRAVRSAGGADAVFCTRGGSVSVDAAVKVCARGGSVVLFQSIPSNGSITLDANDIHYREISILGSISQRIEDFWQAKRLLEQNPAMIDDLNIELIAHNEATVAFDRSLHPAVNRVLVTF